MTTQANVTQAGGFNLETVQLQSVEKIEELFLYLIEQNKRIEALENEVRLLRAD